MALPLYEEVYEIAKGTLGAERVVASVRNSLALCHQDLGDLEESISLFETALSSAIEEYESGHFNAGFLARSYSNLGFVLLEHGDLARAEMRRKNTPPWKLVEAIFRDDLA